MLIYGFNKNIVDNVLFMMPLKIILKFNLNKINSQAGNGLIFCPKCLFNKPINFLSEC